MKVIQSPLHIGHSGGVEFNEGQIVPCHERPSRAEFILKAVEDAGLPVLDAEPYGLDPVLRVHDEAFVAFLRDAWRLWQEAGRTGSVLPFTFAGRSMRRDRPPRDIDGLLGYYCFAAETPIVEGTFDAALGAVDCALTGAALIAGGRERAAYALCRPPGHHAAHSVYGGYCYLNNAAVAAQWLRDHGMERVAVLDVDYHHGNGTQDIFYERADVQFVSLHADPLLDFPYYLGHADETGAGAGEGFTVNLPLPWGTDWEGYAHTLGLALDRVRAFQPDAVVVSLGVDTYVGDPISRFTLTTDRYAEMGAMIEGLDLPTLFVQEGGYAVEAIGDNVVATLEGFMGRR